VHHLLDKYLISLNNFIWKIDCAKICAKNRKFLPSKNPLRERWETRP
jgi:hypothetical protein